MPQFGRPYIIGKNNMSKIESKLCVYDEAEGEKIFWLNFCKQQIMPSMIIYFSCEKYDMVFGG